MENDWTERIEELTKSRDEWERLTLEAKAGFEGLLADYLDAARRIEQAGEFTAWLITDPARTCELIAEWMEGKHET